jgi:hypothetical protein
MAAMTKGLSADVARLRELERDVKKMARALATLMVWIGDSANSPLRRDEVEQLLAMLPEA